MTAVDKPLCGQAGAQNGRSPFEGVLRFGSAPCQAAIGHIALVSAETGSWVR